MGIISWLKTARGRQETLLPTGRGYYTEAVTWKVKKGLHSQLMLQGRPSENPHAPHRSSFSNGGEVHLSTLFDLLALLDWSAIFEIIVPLTRKRCWSSWIAVKTDVFVSNVALRSTVLSSTSLLFYDRTSNFFFKSRQIKHTTTRIPYLPKSTPRALIFQKQTKKFQKPSVSCTPPFEKSSVQTHWFHVLPPLKNHHQSPSVSCTPPFEKSPSKPIGFVYFPLWKITVFGGRLFRQTRIMTIRGVHSKHSTKIVTVKNYPQIVWTWFALIGGCRVSNPLIWCKFSWDKWQLFQIYYQDFLLENNFRLFLLLNSTKLINQSTGYIVETSSAWGSGRIRPAMPPCHVSMKSRHHPLPPTAAVNQNHRQGSSASSRRPLTATLSNATYGN